MQSKRGVNATDSPPPKKSIPSNGVWGSTLGIAQAPFLPTRMIRIASSLWDGIPTVTVTVVFATFFKILYPTSFDDECFGSTRRISCALMPTNLHFSAFTLQTRMPPMAPVRSPIRGPIYALPTLPHGRRRFP
eukprot:3785366-Amphidinium_carterae.1